MKKHRVFITGDTHGWHDIDKLNSDNFPEGNTLTKEDIVMICGDAGLVWAGAAADRRKIQWISSRPFTTVYCDGNHEGFPLFEEYEEVDFYGAKAHKISDSLYHIKRGEIMELDGRTYFFFGGAFSHDRESRTKDYDWFMEELPVQSEYDHALDQLAAHEFRVDYLITHDVPLKYNMRMGFHGVSPRIMGNYEKKYLNICAVLQNIQEMTAYTAWFAGHYHVNERYDRLQVLLDDIVEIDDSEYGYRVLENHVRETMGRVFTREELKQRLTEEDLYISHNKIGTWMQFGMRDPAMKASEYFDVPVTDDELRYVTALYNLYTVKKMTGDV